ncbi:MAG: ABC transporter permease [Acidiferrobacteraceae bacterium]|nr:ABC transporter permease [Acidiferrobacteraceae bacterium]HJP08239.1 ABC transporter permease subunit [Arenicellales bacterium]|tara:strand:- start:89 stop:2092 length:2004 start_codon:yes stop_codon:yes gene_type:complete
MAARPGSPGPTQTPIWFWAIFAGLATLGIALLFSQDHAPYLSKYPRDWIIPLRFWISDAMYWLVKEFDLGLFTFKELTRSISWLLEWPLSIANNFLATGFTFSTEPGASVILPPAPWIAIVAIFGLLAFHLSGLRLAILVTGCFLYLAFFGQWHSAMITLSSIVIAVPLGVIIGFVLGITAYRHPLFEKWLTPILDLMQTVPVFAYLVPVLFLFGFGPVAAMIATMIYATPPMVRVTILSLRQVPEELLEYGNMAGCTRGQLLRKIQIPAARKSLMVGVNQVIMLSLNMVIIASMIGAGGLGFDVLSSLRRLAIGNGLEAGLAITLLAITLDRLSQAFTDRPQHSHSPQGRSVIGRYRLSLIVLVILSVSWFASRYFPALGVFPESLQITTSQFWDNLVKWINVNFFDQLEAIKTFVLINIMMPVKRFLLKTPWVIVVAVIGLIGYRLGHLRLAALGVALATFIAATGLWSKAMVTVYLCGVSVLFAAFIGVPIGILAAANSRINRITQVVIDTLQTLPSFVYLIPVVMLFRVGDFAAMLAVIAYSIAPAIRYTILGIQQVPVHLIEASSAMGCTRSQIRWRVQLPIALPQIMLGINQTIMMALSMLVITALVGTRDLGQEVYIALTKADTGRGIVAGIGVACIAIIADRFINQWSRKKKREFGLPV